MNTIIIPIDFSKSAVNAANYVAALSHDRDIKRMILVTNHYVSFIEEIYPTADYVQRSEEQRNEKRNELLRQLEALKTELLKKLSPETKVEVMVSELPLVRTVLVLIYEENIGLMVVGSNGNEPMEQSYIGSRLIELTKASPIPVLIIPPHIIYQPVETALVAADFKSLANINLLERLQKIKQWRNCPSLSLLNVNHATDNEGGDLKATVKEKLQMLLQDFEYDLNYADDRDVLHGIISFADQSDQQIIIALPGKHSFLYNLTHQSISNGLAANANKPVLILK